MPGIPNKSITLDPTIRAFDPQNPLEPFKLADGTLKTLLNRAKFLELQAKLMETLARLIEAKETIMKAVGNNHRINIKAAAKEAIENPDLHDATLADEQTPNALVKNEKTLRAVARSEGARRILVEEAIYNPDLHDAILAHKDAPEAIAANDELMQKLLGPELYAIWKKRQQS